MSFKDNLATDANNVFLNTNEFAEDITYTPKGGSPKSIKAIIVRSRLDTGGEDAGRILRKQAEIYIANDATIGVDSIDKGDDKVQFPEIPGGSNITWAVLDILRTGKMWHLLVGR